MTYVATAKYKRQAENGIDPRDGGTSYLTYFETKAFTFGPDATLQDVFSEIESVYGDYSLASEVLEVIIYHDVKS